jgi:dihydrofolate reductase
MMVQPLPLELIVARARNGAIGRDGALPWRLPEDLAYFRRTTMGHALIMGRKTWDSLGRPLPGRLNIVVTRNPHWLAKGAVAATSLDDAVDIATRWFAAGVPGVTRPDGSALDTPPSPTAFIIGGAQLYETAMAALALAKLHVTEVDTVIEGDAWFPPFDPGAWRAIERDDYPVNPERPLGFAIVRYLPRAN